MFSRAWHRLRVFFCSALFSFSASSVNCVSDQSEQANCGLLAFSRAWHRLRVFPHLVTVTYFSALGSSYVFSRAWHQLCVFPPLAPVMCFPALGTSYVFSRAWHHLRVFLCLVPWLVFPRACLVVCFPAFGTSVAGFPALGIGCVLQGCVLQHLRITVLNCGYLISFQARYDIDHALVLAQMHHFKAGILYLYEKAKL